LEDKNKKLKRLSERRKKKDENLWRKKGLQGFSVHLYGFSEKKERFT